MSLAIYINILIFLCDIYFFKTEYKLIHPSIVKFFFPVDNSKLQYITVTVIIQTFMCIYNNVLSSMTYSYIQLDEFR